MTPTDILRGVDHAAVQSDRWLAIALLVFILLGGCWLIRMVLGSMMRQMTSLVQEFTKDREELIGVIKSNTAVVAANSENARTQAEALRELAKEVSRCGNVRGH